ncbi:BTAD domain-containing putative transcriptional regulator [Streptomyces platensis]|uniref:AfsR/SARP family transcriptional regulator n=1 Tax=Streptomyces platensis TaxID=58346 RepID=UPI0036A14E81
MAVSRASFPQGQPLRPADPRSTEGLRFTVLGPVRAWRGATPLAAGSPQQRALLAALLLRGGRSATAPELVEALWGDEPPHAALAALRTYAARIRKALGADAEALVSESGGYAIRSVGSQPIDLDHDRAEEYATAAERARSQGNIPYARKLLTDALELWDGEPLAGLAGPYAEQQRTRLEEWRLSLLETRLELDLEDGRHAEAVSELTALTSAHPLREELRRLLMLALYRSGRQAEALAVYSDARRLLDYELGVDPSSALTDLQQRILRADSALDGRPRVAEEVLLGQVSVRPHQIPATVSDFTGREPLVRQLVEQLTAHDGRVMTVASVAGTGGVGKTTLAVHVALLVRNDFPDGQLYADLQGAGQTPADPEAVLGAFLRALGTPDTLIPDGVAERSAYFRSVLNGRRILILLDNARDAVQVRPLLPGNEGCAALITSRTRMIDLAGAELFDLDVMSPDEAFTLFTRITGPERVLPEKNAVMDVVGACGFLPAALRIAASRLAARRTWTVSTLARKLADERRRLDELRAGDLAVTASFELGYGQLERRQARAFRLLGLADGPDISLPAAAAVIGADIDDAEDLCESLVDVSLLESAAPGRYRFHDLVRLYARSCAERDAATPDELDEAFARLLDFYLATAAEMYSLEGDRLVDHVVQPTHQVGLDLHDFAAAHTWLQTEARSLLSCAQQAAKGPGLRPAADLLLLTRDLSDPRANAAQYEQACITVLNAAHEEGERTAEARAHTALSHAYILAGRLEEADDHALKAMSLTARAHDPVAAGYAARNRGVVALSRQRYDDAERLLRQALTSAVEDRDELSEAATRCDLSQLHRDTARIDQAIQLAEEAVNIYRRLGATRRLGVGEYALGLAYAQADRLDDATAQLSGALANFHENRQRFWEGLTHVRLAETRLRAHRADTAAHHAEQALVALGRSGGDRHRATALTVLGKALSQIGQDRRARVCWEEARHILTSLGEQEDAEHVSELLDTVEMSPSERRTS